MCIGCLYDAFLNIHEMEGRIIFDWIAKCTLMRIDRTIFNDIIVPLTDMWSNAQVLEAVKNHLVIFKPKVRVLRNQHDY